MTISICVSDIVDYRRAATAAARISSTESFSPATNTSISVSLKAASACSNRCAGRTPPSGPLAGPSRESRPNRTSAALGRRQFIELDHADVGRYTAGEILDVVLIARNYRGEGTQHGGCCDDDCVDGFAHPGGTQDSPRFLGDPR
ncbi:MAG TPA: hypothetical protein VGX96_02820 [Candidatus Elarobacter sp.]|nr:hypothetical protein [Candidatus Elarobacter sp.]